MSRAPLGAAGQFLYVGAEISIRSVMSNSLPAGTVPGVPVALRALHARLLSWLNDTAVPLWTNAGVDPLNGGFEESLDLTGKPLRRARRARVQARQVFSLAVAAGLGWRGDAAPIVRRAIDWLLAHYRRPDGLFRALVSPAGEALDQAAMLYDQAFVLLGLASAAALLDAPAEFEAEARALRSALTRELAVAGSGFLSSAGAPALRESNPHMHLLEACLAWTAVGADPEWREWADVIIAIALERMRLPGSGAIGEEFDARWHAPTGAAGQRIEPGHQFEWAWLLLQGGQPPDSARYRTAMRLLALGETYGVAAGFAFNTLSEELVPVDRNARLWPQTERLKANALAAALTGERPYWDQAAAAAEALLTYLATEPPGLWHDLRLADGGFADSWVPASSLYHIACSIDVLDRVIRSADAQGP